MSNNDSVRVKPRSTNPMVRLFSRLLRINIFENRRLSDFEMIEEPASVRNLKEALLEHRSSSNPLEALMHIAEEGSRYAVAEVTVHSGIWPFRSSSRKRIMRQSCSRYWTFESGEFTPGMQAEELERRWAIAYDYKRRFLLQRSFETAASSDSSVPNN